MKKFLDVGFCAIKIFQGVSLGNVFCTADASQLVLSLSFEAFEANLLTRGTKLQRYGPINVTRGF